MQNLDWNNIRAINNSQKDGFEELVCQLAKSDNIENSKSFIRKGSPDAGVECFWTLKDDKEVCYQAKFFTAPLTSTQWSEVDESVRTALNKHPNLIKYIISIPQDRADARVLGRKSFLDKWNESVSKWQEWAQEKGNTVEFVYEGSSELFNKLSRAENMGKTLFWFNKDEYSDFWFKKQNNSKIKNLGARYTPEINVELDITYIFDGLYLNEKFKENININIEKSFKEFSDFINMTKDISELNIFLQERFIHLKDRFKIVDNKNYKGRYSSIRRLFEYTHNYIAAYCGQRICFEQVQNEDRKKVLTKNFDDFLESLFHVYSGLQNMDSTLADNPYLIIDGEAGIGKSHLIADVITKNYSNEHYSILLLGQHFHKEDIWTQIKNQLEITVSKEEFLGALNSKAESLDSRIIIYIDAINEGEGKYLWKNQLSGLFEDLKCFPNIGLVVTLRTTYKDLVLPENLLNDIAHFKHRGFDDTFKATKKFFEYYKIKEPPVPILNPEFNNPLFLKLFCIGLSENGINTIPQDYDSLDTIFGYLIKAVNRSLSEKFDYDVKDFDLVSESISILVETMIKSPSFQISRKEARDLLTKNLKNEVDQSRNILSELINENILTENVVYNYQTEKFDNEIIYFSYERLGDYFIVQSLLNDDIEVIKKAGRITSDTNVYQFIKDETSIIRNQNLIEILSISLPEKTGFELHELIDITENYAIAESFLKSLIWRNANTVSEKIVDYINKSILTVVGLNRLFLDTLIQLSLRKEHYLNVYFLDSYLSEMKMTDRDYHWTIYINDSEVASTFSNWVLESAIILRIDDDSKKLIALTLTWLLTSSNRELRDVSTKGLVKIFQDNLELLKKLLDSTDDIDDLYVLERLFAVGYGATLRTRNHAQIRDFSKFIFDKFFKMGNPIEHHLLRDYARGIIEYAVYLDLIDVNVSLIRPPYKSKMPVSLPLIEEVKAYKTDADDLETQNNLYNLVMGFSDFARYTLGTNHYSRISSITVQSYNVFQQVCKSSKENKREIEKLIELCKNYKSEFVRQEWKDLAKNLYEDLETGIQSLFKLSVPKAKLLRDYIEKISDDYFSKNIRFDISILQRLIITDVFKTFAWKKQYFAFHDYRDLRDSYFNKETYSKKESIGKKYILISYYKWLAIILDNYLTELDYSSIYDDKFEPYTGGSWSTNRRDIDPTLLHRSLYKEDTYENENITYWYPKNKIDWKNPNYAKWVLEIKDLVHPKNLIDVKDNNDKQWFNLFSYPSWKNDEDLNGSKKEVWYHIKSYVINKDDKNEILKELKNKSFFNHQIPQEKDIYDVYSREYYWSKAYDDCTYENHPENSDRRLHTEVNGKNIAGQQTSMNYVCYDHRDYSVTQHMHIKRPTKYFFNLLDLQFGENEYEFYDPSGNLVLFTPAIKYQEGNDCLLVDKNYLIRKLKSKNLEIIWLVLGAKEVVGSMSITNEGQINNIFYLDDTGSIVGDFSIEARED